MEAELRSKIIEFGARAVKSWGESKPAELSPQITTDIQAVLAGYAAMLEEELAELDMREPIWKSGLIDVSEAERNREWAATPDGQRQIKLKYLVKSVDRVIAACKRRMDRFSNESFNRY